MPTVTPLLINKRRLERVCDIILRSFIPSAQVRALLPAGFSTRAGNLFLKLIIWFLRISDWISGYEPLRQENCESAICRTLRLPHHGQPDLSNASEIRILGSAIETKQAIEFHWKIGGRDGICFLPEFAGLPRSLPQTILRT